MTCALEHDNRTLRDRVEELEDALGVSTPMPPGWPGGRFEWQMFSMIAKRGAIGREQVLIALYGHKHADERPSVKVLDVFMYRIRRILKPAGIIIDTLWGHGWTLTPQMRERAQALVERLQRGEAP